MGDVLKFENKHELPVNVIGRNEKGEMTINGNVVDLGSSGGISIFDPEEEPSC